MSNSEGLTPVQWTLTSAPLNAYFSIRPRKGFDRAFSGGVLLH
ncbi:hypothetical protein MRBBS_0266 [Marinobacter sp. BSs20148]|nr:hypothetical protein MRBBS_0266 [Marinobacter sp. BSs20148]